MESLDMHHNINKIDAKTWQQTFLGNIDNSKERVIQ